MNMTVANLACDPHITVLTAPSSEREIEGVYIGDLLSWVMGKASADYAWITIMSNANAIAVAALTDVSCIILAEGVTLPEDVVALAGDKGINVLSSSLPAYETALLINGELK